MLQQLDPRQQLVATGYQYSTQSLRRAPAFKNGWLYMVSGTSALTRVGSTVSTGWFSCLRVNEPGWHVGPCRNRVTCTPNVSAHYIILG